MNYELCKELKDTGFVQKEVIDARYMTPGGLYALYPDVFSEEVYIPTLSELIAACGEEFGYLILNPENGMWLAREKGIEPIHPELSGHRHFSTPEEAVARLWLSINKKH